MIQGFSDVMVGDFLQSDSQWREVFVVRDVLERFLLRARSVNKPHLNHESSKLNHTIKKSHWRFCCRENKIFNELHPLLLDLIHRALDNPTAAGTMILPKFEEFINCKVQCAA